MSTATDYPEMSSNNQRKPTPAPAGLSKEPVQLLSQISKVQQIDSEMYLIGVINKVGGFLTDPNGNTILASWLKMSKADAIKLANEILKAAGAK